MRREVGMRKSYAREANDAHGGVCVFENTLTEKDQTYGQADQQRARPINRTSLESISLRSQSTRLRLFQKA